MKWAVTQWAKVGAVHIDGILYFTMAVCMSMVASLSSDAAYKYIDPYLLFWGKTFFEALGAGSTAVKTFRSTAFAESKSKKENPTP